MKCLKNRAGQGFIFLAINLAHYTFWRKFYFRRKFYKGKEPLYMLEFELWYS